MLKDWLIIQILLQIGENVVIDKAIIAENCSIGDNVTLGVGEEKPNKFNEKIYSFGLLLGLVNITCSTRGFDCAQESRQLCEWR